MTDELIIDGEQFISSKRASELSGYEQDYIGQLCRGGNIKARRVGGLWYISVDSLTNYRKRAEEYSPEAPRRSDVSDYPDSLLTFDGRGYVSAARAAKITGYSADYVGQMARAGTIPSRQVGNRWYVDQAEVIRHKTEKDALLAAVQVQSVGLSNRRDRLTGNEEDIAVGPPLLQYTSDERELLPAIDSGIGENSVEKMEPENGEIEEHVIPIRIHIADEKISKTQAPDRHVALEPRHSLLPMLLPVGLFTIVIILSLGFVSLKRSSTYTSNIYNNDKADQLASVGTTVIGKIGDFLEEWIVPELVYERGR